VMTTLHRQSIQWQLFPGHIQWRQNLKSADFVSLYRHNWSRGGETAIYHHFITTLEWRHQ
jgi:hypothetical protein